MSYVKGDKEVSLRLYNIIIGGGLIFGLILNILMYQLISNIYPNLVDLVDTVGKVIIVIGSFSILISACCFYVLSEHFSIKLISFSLIALVMGGVISLAFVAASYTVINIINVWAITLIIVVIMLLFEMIQKEYFVSMNTAICICMSVILIFELLSVKAEIFTPARLDYICIFWGCYWIKENWLNVKNEKHTIYNAIKSIHSLYYCTVTLYVNSTVK